MVKIILVRHGETDWNREQVFRGRIDVPLNQTGVSQARAVRESLRDRKIDEVYASPLGRALETARMLARGSGSEVKEEEGFIDVDFGSWQGLSRRQVKDEHKDLYETWRARPEAVQFPGGESLEDVRRRSMEALAGIIKNHPGKTLAVVSHRVVNKVLLCTMLGLELSRFWYLRQDTCCINMLEYRDGDYFLSLLNDTCHLRGVQGASAADF